MKFVGDQIQIHYETLFHNMFIFGCAAYSNEQIVVHFRSSGFIMNLIQRKTDSTQLKFIIKKIISNKYKVH